MIQEQLFEIICVLYTEALIKYLSLKTQLVELEIYLLDTSWLCADKFALNMLNYCIDIQLLLG